MILPKASVFKIGLVTVFLVIPTILQLASHVLITTVSPMFPPDHNVAVSPDAPSARTRTSPLVDENTRAKNTSLTLISMERYQRFPSVEERVRLYMSNWYFPPCGEKSNVLYSVFEPAEDAVQPEAPKQNNHSARTTVVINVQNQVKTRNDKKISITGTGNKQQFQLDHDPQFARVFRMDREKILNCSLPRDQPKKQQLLASYCEDVVKIMFPALDRIGWETVNGQTKVPLLLQFGDSEKSVKPEGGSQYVMLPYIHKFRRAVPQQQRSLFPPLPSAGQCLDRPETTTVETYQEAGRWLPIIWLLRVDRHFGSLAAVKKNDSPWEKKINRAVFRASLTGTGYKDLQSDEERCLVLPRCRLVYQKRRNSRLNAGLVNTRDIVSNTVNGVNLVKRELPKQSMLRYKMIVMIEGNDLASGLKWALYSSSVVLMQPPTFTSWAMEELLEPWVHYIPLNENLTDVDEKIHWVLKHDKEARSIARRGTLWISDLMIHPDAKEDNNKVFDEILRRYKAHFVG